MPGAGSLGRSVEGHRELLTLKTHLHRVYVHLGVFLGSLSLLRFAQTSAIHVRLRDQLECQSGAELEPLAVALGVEGIWDSDNRLS